MRWEHRLRKFWVWTRFALNVAFASLLLRDFRFQIDQSIALGFALGGLFSLVLMLLEAIDRRDTVLEQKWRKLADEVEGITQTVEPLRPNSETRRAPSYTSYKLELTIHPNWEELTEAAAKQAEMTAEELVQQIRSTAAWERGAALCGKTFRFVFFNDAVTGIHQIWSDHHKTFVEEACVSGQFTEFNKSFLTIWTEGPRSFLNRSLVFTPSVVGFQSSLPFGLESGDVDHKTAFNEIDMHLFLRLFLEMNRHSEGSHLFAVRQFPERHRKQLETAGAVYETNWWNPDRPTGFNANDHPANEKEWFRKQGLELCMEEARSHLFRMKFYTLAMALEIFEPFDRR
jgi:hypothetical protein